MTIEFSFVSLCIQTSFFRRRSFFNFNSCDVLPKATLPCHLKTICRRVLRLSRPSCLFMHFPTVYLLCDCAMKFPASFMCARAMKLPANYISARAMEVPATLMLWPLLFAAIRWNYFSLLHHFSSYFANCCCCSHNFLAWDPTEYIFIPR